MFDYDNLQVICWKCNLAKGDNNAYDLHHCLIHNQQLVKQTIKQFPLL